MTREDLGGMAGVAFHAIEPSLFLGLTDAPQAGFFVIGGLIIVADEDHEGFRHGLEVPPHRTRGGHVSLESAPCESKE